MVPLEIEYTTKHHIVTYRFSNLKQFLSGITVFK